MVLHIIYGASGWFFSHNSVRIANQTYNSSYNVSVSSPTYTASANLASGGSRSNSGSSSGLVATNYTVKVNPFNSNEFITLNTDRMQSTSSAMALGGLACGASVVCAPAVPVIEVGAWVVGGAGVLLDDTTSVWQKASILLVPYGAGKAMNSTLKNTPHVSKNVKNGMNFAADQSTGLAVGKQVGCANGSDKNCSHLGTR